MNFIEEKSEIINLIDLGKDYYHIVISSPAISKLARPGQFVNIKVTGSLFPLLRRPFSIWSAKENYIEVLCKEVGIGTKFLREKKFGRLSLLGPLGKPFPEPSPEDTIVLLGGGTGIAPLSFYAERISENKKIFLAGFKHLPSSYLLRRMEEVCETLLIATEDGSMGFKGLLSELIEKEFKNIESEYTKYFICGPYPMLKVFEKTLPHERTFVSLEGIMACGFGICMGCAVRKKGEDRYLRTCTDGTLFSLKDIEL